jgi:predicted DNA-binding antitoxin AbrB/MazE fold protein
MTLLGHIRNGRIELDQPLSLPEGTKVKIEILDGTQEITGQSLGERLLKYAGRITDAPSDLADQHDHYLHGTPKK